MQDEVNEKTMALMIKGGKISAKILEAALRKWLQETNKTVTKVKQKQVQKKEAPKQGKQTLRSLQKQGMQLSTIEVTDQNIKSFDRVARKYGVDFSLKKDKSVTPPRYIVFFKARDVEVMTKAFQEYTGVTLNKAKRPSIRKRLEIAKERVAKDRERVKTKTKERNPER